jgi:glycosyltransferase involved in cell wall biosynthesis
MTRHDVNRAGRAARRLPRVLVLTHYYPPELGAPQTRLRATARLLTELGHEVRVVTGPPHYPDGRVRGGRAAWLPRRESLDGIDIRRLPMLPRPNRGLLDRTLDQGSFALAATAALPTARWSDVLLVESPPLFLGLTAAWLRRLAGRPYVFHVADPWPDFPVAMGGLESPWIRRIAYGIEALAYREAALITTVTPSLVALLDAKPAATGRVRLLPNGVELERFAPGRGAAEARRELGWSEAGLHLVYAGSVGLAQGVGSLLEAAAGLEGVTVHVVGQGYERDALAARARLEGVRAIRFEQPVASDEFPRILAAADAVVVLLRAGPLYEGSLPTKLLEGLAAGRPLLVSAAGEAARIVRDARAGIVVAPESPAALRASIVDLAGRPAADLARMGLAARHAAEDQFDRRQIAVRLSDYLVEAARGGRDATTR